MICPQCKTSFKKEKGRQIFCREHCNRTYWQEQSKPKNLKSQKKCFYCGDPKVTGKDTLLPRSLQEESFYSSNKRQSPGESVPACRKCSSLLRDKAFPTIEERWEYLIYRLTHYPYSKEDFEEKLSDIEGELHTWIELQQDREEELSELRTTHDSTQWNRWKKFRDKQKIKKLTSWET